MSDVTRPPAVQRSGGASCLCLTYGRPALLEEAVESFLRQTWEGPKELVIVNDHPEQDLRFEHPEVSIFNLGRRLRTLGEKRNLSVALARHDNLLVWDDDDIYLPWRIAETMKKLPFEQFYKCPNAWCITGGAWQERPGYNLYHGGSAFTRWLFERAGGYGFLNGGEDADIEWRFQLVTSVKGEYWKHTLLPEHRIYYVYRWGHGYYHATGQSDLRAIAPEVTRGTIPLRPHWKHPYDEIALSKARRDGS